MFLPYSVDLRPIGACNLRCPFCFGPRHEVSTMDATAQRAAVDFITSHGAKAIVVSGGEPTLLPQLPRLLEHIKASGLETVVSTNGVLLPQLLPQLAPNLDWVALPIDGQDDASDARMRVGSSGHLANTLELMRTIRRRYPRVSIKLGTVVTHLNARAVVDIPRVLPEEARPDVWKLYQVSFTNYGRDNRAMLELAEDEFDRIVDRAYVNATSNGIPLTVYRNRDRDGKYLFIDPNGDAKVVNAGDEQTIGNIFTDPKDVIAAVQRFVDFSRCRQNYAQTYPHGARRSSR